MEGKVCRCFRNCRLACRWCCPKFSCRWSTRWWACIVGRWNNFLLTHQYFSIVEYLTTIVGHWCWSLGKSLTSHARYFVFVGLLFLQLREILGLDSRLRLRIHQEGVVLISSQILRTSAPGDMIVPLFGHTPCIWNNRPLKSWTLPSQPSEERFSIYLKVTAFYNRQTELLPVSFIVIIL